MRIPTNCLTTTIRLLGVCLVLLAAHAARAGCEVQQRAVVALQALHGHLLVPLAVNGTTAHFVLDTGAERSLVTPQAVQRLGLALDEWVGTTMHGIGGVTEHRNADPRSLTLGGVPLQRHTLTHDTSLTVGPMPITSVDGLQIDGLLGRDFLSVFDLSIDLKKDMLTLYEVRDCSGKFLPWTQPYTAIPAQRPTDTAIVLPVSLDGHPLRALLDTGASASVLTTRGMAMLGLTNERLAHDAPARAAGVGPRVETMRQHRFASLRVGTDTDRDPVIWVAPIHVVPIVDMLLGADWLVGREVWISFATSQVFVAG